MLPFAAAPDASPGCLLRKMPPSETRCMRAAVLAVGAGGAADRRVAAASATPAGRAHAARPMTEGTSANSGQLPTPPHCALPRAVPAMITCV